MGRKLVTTTLLLLLFMSSDYSWPLPWTMWFIDHVLLLSLMLLLKVTHMAATPCDHTGGFIGMALL